MTVGTTLLLSMPFGALERPALGLSLLKAGLVERGFACDARYPTFTFAEYIGFETYQWMSFELPYTAFAGDWTFTTALYGERVAEDRRYVEEVLRETWHLEEHSIARLRRVRYLVPHFIAHCLEAIPWRDYAIVGFTSTFEQNIASLALARRIKAAHPSVTIVFGGANWEGEMGEALHERFPFVDYVCSGEADESFPMLVERVLARGSVAADPIPGVVYREEGRTMSGGVAPLVRDLDKLPIPDFSDYFRAIEQSTVGAAVVPTLLFESSRGCWWGAKSHCTFCGLNGGTMAFRSKSAERVLDELALLVSRWQTDLVEAVDNILDMRYFNDLLPALARAAWRPRLFFEVKANLTRAQVLTLRDAGVRRIQPGIESLSDHVLRLMRKGTTALRNIQLLKWCRSAGVAADWNLLYGFPGETREDYAAMLPMLRAIRFLGPPSACAPIRLDRFSPFYDAPADFGFQNVRPIAPYAFLYPFDSVSLAAIAYYFDYDYRAETDPHDAAAEVAAFVDTWRREPEPGMLSSVVSPDGTLILFDTRSGAVQPQVVLTGAERVVYEYCDQFRSLPTILDAIREHCPDIEVGDQEIMAFIESLVSHHLMITDGVHYLSLAIQTQVNTAPHTSIGYAPWESRAISTRILTPHGAEAE